jgi:hypothetical protein
MPEGFFVDAASTVYVADSSAGAIVKKVTGAAKTTILTIASASGVVMVPGTTDLITTSTAGAVQRWPAGAAPATTIATLPLARQPFITQSGDLYVPAGTQVKKFVGATGSGTDVLTTAVTEATGVWVDASGNAFITDGGGVGSVLKVDSTGTQTTIATNLGTLRGITGTTGGDLFYAVFSTGTKVMKIPAGSSTPVSFQVMGDPT